MSWLKFKSIHSDSLGVIVSAYPEIVRPQERVEMVQVPGRSGDMTLISGRPVYESRERRCECLILPNADINAISAWLSGRGDVIFGNEPNYAYEAHIIEEIAFDKILREREYRDFSVSFRCQPLKKLAAAEANIVLTANGSVSNPGTADSRPSIKVEGSGNIMLMVAGQILRITGLTQPIVIDSGAGLATDATGTINMSYLCSGDYPILKPGINAISWTGTVTRVTITPKWRWL